jgi:CRISPR-associated protein Cas1
MEELRAYLGDRFILSLINRKQITRSDFKQQSEDSILLTDNGRRTFLQAWQSRKKEEITHPFINEKIPIGLIPYIQAQLLARHLRGDLDAYPVFLIK